LRGEHWRLVPRGNTMLSRSRWLGLCLILGLLSLVCYAGFSAVVAIGDAVSKALAFILAVLILSYAAFFVLCSLLMLAAIYPIECGPALFWFVKAIAEVVRAIFE
jgi:hypothetical protein